MKMVVRSRPLISRGRKMISSAPSMDSLWLSTRSCSVRSTSARSRALGDLGQQRGPELIGTREFVVEEIGQRALGCDELLLERLKFGSRRIFSGNGCQKDAPLVGHVGRWFGDDPLAAGAGSQLLGQPGVERPTAVDQIGQIVGRATLIFKVELVGPDVQLFAQHVLGHAPIEAAGLDDLGLVAGHGKAHGPFAVNACPRANQF